MYISKTETYKFKAKENISWYNFCLRTVSQDLRKDAQNFIEWYCVQFSVDYSSIKKEDILNNHQYLMIKNNTK